MNPLVNSAMKSNSDGNSGGLFIKVNSVEENDLEGDATTPTTQKIGLYNPINEWKHSTAKSIVPQVDDQSETILLFCASVDERDQLQRAHLSGSRENSKELLLLAHQHSHIHAPTLSLHTIWNVFWQVRVPALSVMMTFTVTISIFPSVMVFLESTQKCHSSERFYNDLFVPFLFLLYNLCDFSGRLLAGYLTSPFNARNVWIPAVARLVFIPLFLLCKLSSSRLPIVFDNDAFPVLFMVFFASTNGYVASCCMMLGSSMVAGRESSLAGTIMVFFLTLGLCLGACTSFINVYISQGSFSR